jgi:2-methylcitrate dehydratase PrpD
MQAHTAWKNHLPPSTTKYLLAGWMSQAAITAASLAELGHRGDVAAMDGEYGFWRYAGAKKWDPSLCLDKLGKVWFFPGVTTFKPYPACRVMHGAFDCLAAIVEREDLRPDEIEGIRAYMESSVDEPLWQQLKQVETCVDAQFNVAFTLSLVAHRIEPGPRWSDPDILTNKSILKFMDRITYGEHPRYVEDLGKDPRSRTSKVEVVARGKTFVHEKRYIKGSPSPDPETYMTDDELIAKFRVNAARILTPSKIDAAVDALVHLENVDDVGAVARLFSL